MPATAKDFSALLFVLAAALPSVAVVLAFLAVVWPSRGEARSLAGDPGARAKSAA